MQDIEWVKDRLGETEINKIKQLGKDRSIDGKRVFGAVVFCILLLDGETKTDAYQTAFDVSREDALRVASQFSRSVWVSEIFSIVEGSDDVDTTITRLDVQDEMKDIMQGQHEVKDRIAAAKVLLDIEKEKNKKKEVEAAEKKASGLETLMNLLVQNANSGKLMKNDEFIDVGILE